MTILLASLLLHALCAIAAPLGEPVVAAGKVGVGFCGDNGRLAALLDDPRYATYPLSDPDPAGLRQTRVLVLANLTTPAGPGSQLVANLRRFVEQGGGLMLCGETCRLLASPLPEAVVGWSPCDEAADGWHARSRLMKVTDGRWIIEEFTGQLFWASEPRHLTLKMGPEGATIILDREDRPVVIGGRLGGGKAIFSGCDYRRLKIPSREADVTRTLLAYLAGFAGGPLKQG